MIISNRSGFRAGLCVLGLLVLGACEPTSPDPFDVAEATIPAMVAALEEGYPAQLRAEGIGGTVQVWFFVTEENQVIRTLVNESSRHRELDNAAIRVADLIEFTPALNRDRRVPVWISLPITFTTR